MIPIYLSSLLSILFVSQTYLYNQILYCLALLSLLVFLAIIFCINITILLLVPMWADFLYCFLNLIFFLNYIAIIALEPWFEIQMCSGIFSNKWNNFAILNSLFLFSKGYVFRIMSQIKHWRGIIVGRAYSLSPINYFLHNLHTLRSK